MSKKRGRAFRRWKTFTKYVSKVKERMGWYVDDPNAPRGHRHPKNWKEMDTDDAHEVKMLKKTSTRWSSKWEDCEGKTRIKKMRQDDRNIIEDGLNND
jgi:hypothetical protein